jgi:hypothetical protein
MKFHRLGRAAAPALFLAVALFLVVSPRARAAGEMEPAASPEATPEATPIDRALLSGVENSVVKIFSTARFPEPFRP